MGKDHRFRCLNAGRLLLRVGVVSIVRGVRRGRMVKTGRVGRRVRMVRRERGKGGALPPRAPQCVPVYRATFTAFFTTGWPSSSSVT